MKKFPFFILMILFSSVYNPSWAMEEEETDSKQNMCVRIHYTIKSEPFYKPAGLRFSEEEKINLFDANFKKELSLIHQISALNLTGEFSEDWSPKLKKFLRLESYQRGLKGVLRDAAHHFTQGWVFKTPALMANYTFISLNLTGTDLTSSKGTYLFRGILKSAPQLIKLKLSQTEITDKWAGDNLVAVSPVCRLKELDLSENRIQEMAPFLLRRFKELHTLNLKNNIMDTYNLFELEHSLILFPPKRLINLYLGGNPGHRRAGRAPVFQDYERKSVSFHSENLTESTL